jgi:signal transduction histidine kinase
MSDEHVIPPGGFDMNILLIWFFVILISALMLCLCFVFLAMRRAQERENMSYTFSGMAIEGMETERQRISRELHDTILPLVRDTVLSDKIRSICINLQPPDFKYLSLNASMADLCMDFTRKTGIECLCSIEENIDFSGIKTENQLHLYRMVQESLTNIEKHSGAANAALVIRKYMKGLSENILICVSDDGAALKGIREADEGLGMRSLRQRAAIVGAKINFVSESGNGLMVRIKIPLPNQKSGNFQEVSDG